MAPMGPVVTQATDSNTDPSCGRVMGPDVVMSISSSPDVTMAPSSSPGLSNQHGPSIRVVPGLQHRFQTVTKMAMDIDTDSG